MNIFSRVLKALNPVPAASQGWRTITEPFSGAWQRNIEESVGDMTTYPTLFACIMRIAKDIGKLPFYVIKKSIDGTSEKIADRRVDPVLEKPNHYQTPQQFRESWQLTKLLQGNAYILKEYDESGVNVVALYPLDPYRVLPLVSESGEVFYELSTGGSMGLNHVFNKVVVPARFIIHDREITLHHPLIGIPPLAAASWPAIKNLRILRSSAEFFGNNSQPGGILTAPGQISDETATRLKAVWNESFSGHNAGRVAVVGDDLKFMPLAAKSIDSQMVEQLKYSDQQICQPFGIPAYKVGIGQLPSGFKPDDVNVQYFSDALSDRIEHMETLLDQGFGLKDPSGIEMDLDPLWRMDEGKRAEVESKLVGGKIKLPNESRLRLNLPPAAGGDFLWGQHQDYPLGMLAERTSVDGSSEPEPDVKTLARDFRRALRRRGIVHVV